MNGRGSAALRGTLLSGVARRWEQVSGTEAKRPKNPRSLVGGSGGAWCGNDVYSPSLPPPHAGPPPAVPPAADAMRKGVGAIRRRGRPQQTRCIGWGAGWKHARGGRTQCLANLQCEQAERRARWRWMEDGRTAAALLRETKRRGGGAFACAQRDRGLTGCHPSPEAHHDAAAVGGCVRIGGVVMSTRC